jgi:hypothetical protein
VAAGDATLGEIVGADGLGDAVTEHDADAVSTNLSGEVGVHRG